MSGDREELIRQRAYALWERDGGAHGRHDDHWAAATREIDGAAATAKTRARAEKAPAKTAPAVKAPAAVATKLPAKPAKAAAKAAGATSRGKRKDV